jgi:site-specific recombinase XerD
MHAVFNHAIRWEWHDRNPISQARQGAKRQRVPIVLDMEQIKSFIRPALKAAGIAGKVGWHTFRHSSATILKSRGEDVKIVQELLRHANTSITLNLYAQAITNTKRSAQSKVARLVFESKERYRR